MASRQFELSVPQTNLVNYGTNSVKTQVAKSWNQFVPLLLEKERKKEKFERKKGNNKYKAKELHDFSISSFSKEISDILLHCNM